MNQISGKKVLVIGLGISGRSAAQFLLKYGAKVVGVDQNADLINKNPVLAELQAQGLKIVHDTASINIKQYELVVVSPGVPTTNRHYQAAVKAKIEIIGEVELACRHLSNRCVGITGTNGKTTVTLLVTHVLNRSGKKAIAIGNVGTPITSELLEKPFSSDILVIELSSYQLETMQSKVLDAAVILNITPDHLDRYPSMAAYADAKINMRQCLKPGAPLYVEENCYNEYIAHFKGFVPSLYGYSPHCTVYTDLENIFFKEKIEYLLPSEYRGKINHDVENLMGAFAICRELGVSTVQFFEALSSFKKPPHRIEYVATVDGVLYYDDSKGTNIDAVMRAVDVLDGKLILIAGGVDKGAAYTCWRDSFHGKVKSICAIGQAAEKIKKDLSPTINVDLFDSLENAVKHAATLAKPGEIVLLSPGCSSFDMFRDYAHRGDEFKKIVKSLISEGGRVI